MKAAKAKAKKSTRKDRGFTAPNGEKTPDAPKDWPFGTKPPEEPAPPAEDPDSDDGLTAEQRSTMSPLEYLLAVMRSPKASKSARITAAIQAAPYVHGKVAPLGKKEQAGAKAKTKASEGKFASASAPRLAAANGRQV